MGITKTDLFSTEQNAMAHMAKVLGHPARIAILQYLVWFRNWDSPRQLFPNIYAN
jgi:hypothetical protein